MCYLLKISEFYTIVTQHVLSMSTDDSTIIKDVLSAKDRNVFKVETQHVLSTEDSSTVLR